MSSGQLQPKPWPAQRVTFHNPQNGFCVLRVKAGASETWSPWLATRR